ncbi:hypothetical protein HYH02_008055 [Chlamydomonas schloesseri]|uniref:Uncharacterized protein n=1 Tax=Chlamydomonas schloesseri TaxID=2026947 RepID=A0A835WGN3_9CHLO|nr:hypothetical protein HYH02_008055 [Chlamydomonas schloesseri]|eukprot:KAG2446899.1 hypothetical protein HYH02_008055 [Chlamydomonas schloesseri]
MRPAAAMRTAAPGSCLEDEEERERMRGRERGRASTAAAAAAAAAGGGGGGGVGAGAGGGGEGGDTLLRRQQAAAQELVLPAAAAAAAARKKGEEEGEEEAAADAAAAAAVWAAAVRVLAHEDESEPAVTWDNVGALLRLGHEYDMAAVRQACGTFLCLHGPEGLSLASPLESPRNVLRAATLAERWLGARVTWGGFATPSLYKSDDNDQPTGGDGGGGGGGGAGSSGDRDAGGDGGGGGGKNDRGGDTAAAAAAASRAGAAKPLVTAAAAAATGAGVDGKGVQGTAPPPPKPPPPPPALSLRDHVSRSLNAALAAALEPLNFMYPTYEVEVTDRNYYKNLEAMRVVNWSNGAPPVVRTLRQLTRHPRYRHLVSASVQVSYCSSGSSSGSGSSGSSSAQCGLPQQQPSSVQQPGNATSSQHTNNQRTDAQQQQPGLVVDWALLWHASPVLARRLETSSAGAREG